MFKKIVSNLPFNPSLIHQVNFYAKRLHKEESIRKISLVFMSLTLLINIVAVASPAQNTLAGTDGHIMQGGGASSISGILQKYDQDPSVRAIYASFDISRADIQKMTLKSINTKASWAQPLVTAGRRPNGSAGEYPRTVGGTTIYVHTLDSAFRADTIQAFVCEASECGRYKAIAIDCGNPINSVNESTITQKEPMGYVDGSDCKLIYGWAFNNQHARYVHIYVDVQPFVGAQKGTHYFEVQATQDTRPDVSSTIPGVPSSVGWSWDGGPLNNDGKSHKVWVYVTDRGSNFAQLTNGNGRTVNFNCPKPTVVTCPSGPLKGKQPKDNDLRNCPESPVASCAKLTALTATVQKGTNARFSMSARTANGASVSTYKLNYGDGSNDTIRTSALSANAMHRYNEVGEYQAVLTVATSEGDKTSADCQVTIQVTPQPVPCPYDPGLLVSDNECQPCLENPLIPASNEELCKPTITLEKKVSNTTQGITDAVDTTAKPGDILEYKLITTNTSTRLEAKHSTKENIADILDYSDLVDEGDTYSMDADKNLVWPEVTIVAGEQLVQTFTVKVKDTIPSTAPAYANQGTYDLKMTNVYGNTTTVQLPCPPSLCAQQTIEKLPNTGPGASIVVTFATVGIIAFFYSRSKVLAKELDILRHEYTAGGLA